MRSVSIIPIIVISALTCFLPTQLNGQDTIIKSDKHHEFGVDLSPLIKGFVAGAGLFGSGYEFSVMYRYHFDTWAIRGGLGGTVNTEESKINDTITDKRDNSHFRIRLGAERKVNFSRRWQIFYGADLYYAHLISKDEVIIKNFYSSMQNGTSNYYGLSPMVGFRFKINKRISFTTENSFLIYYYKNNYDRIFTPDIQRNEISTGEGWQTRFSPMASLLLTVNF